MPSRTDAIARLLSPQADLGGLLAVAVIRDTRGIALGEAERFNCFPASPLCTVTWVAEGRLHRVDETGSIDSTPLPPMFVGGPYHRPLVSWSPGGVHAMTVAVFPDAWSRVTGVAAASLADRFDALDAVLAGEMLQIFRDVLDVDDFTAGFDRLQDRLRSCARAGAAGPSETPPPRLADWTQALAARAAGVGRPDSVRTAQRRVKAWTGQTLRELNLHARLESLLDAGGVRSRGLAEIAADAGYADQSHMGREVRRHTGQSPVRMRSLVKSDPRYWIYRALAARR